MNRGLRLEVDRERLADGLERRGQVHGREVVALLVAAHDPVGRGFLAPGDVAELDREGLLLRGQCERQSRHVAERCRRVLEHPLRVGGVHHVEVDLEELLQEARGARDQEVRERLLVGRPRQRLDVDVLAVRAAEVAAEVGAAAAAATAAAATAAAATAAAVDRGAVAVEREVDRDAGARQVEHDARGEDVDVLVRRVVDVDACGQDLGERQTLHRHLTDDELLGLHERELLADADSGLDRLRERPIAVLEGVRDITARIDREADVPVGVRRLLDLDVADGECDRHAGDGSARVGVLDQQPELAPGDAREALVDEVLVLRDRAGDGDEADRA